MHALARGRDETMRCCWVGLAVLALLGGVDSWWPFGSSAEESEMAEEATATVSEEVSGGRASAVAVGLPVPFEITTAEKKFLSEAQQYLDLPPLEQCQYQVRHSGFGARTQTHTHYLSRYLCIHTLATAAGSCSLAAVVWGDGRRGDGETERGTAQLSVSGGAQAHLRLHRGHGQQATPCLKSR